MIHTSNLRFGYGEKPVLNQLSAQFDSGLTHGIVGLNGSGKTTFFNLLAGFLTPDAGEVRFDDKPLRKGDIAYIDAEPFFYPNLSAREFLSVFPQTNRHYREAELADIFGLPLDELISHYSTGMKRKLLILSQLRQDKAVFIFDEPFNGLDLESNRSLQFIISLLNQKGKTVLVASHILEPLFSICHRIHHLRDGAFAKSYLPESYSTLDNDVFREFNERIKNLLTDAI